MLDNIDFLLKDFLQKDVSLNLKTKTYKSGKLLLFNLSNSYYSLTLVNEKKQETFEIPFPFAVSRGVKGSVIFDYRLETLAEKDYELLISLKSATKIKNCKFYDTILTILPLN